MNHFEPKLVIKFHFNDILYVNDNFDLLTMVFPRGPSMWSFCVVSCVIHRGLVMRKLSFGILICEFKSSLLNAHYLNGVQ